MSTAVVIAHRIAAFDESHGVAVETNRITGETRSNGSTTTRTLSVKPVAEEVNETRDPESFNGYF